MNGVYNMSSLLKGVYAHLLSKGLHGSKRTESSYICNRLKNQIEWLFSAES